MTASRRVLIVVGVVIAVALGLPWGDAVPTASAQTISVASADPPTGEQGTLNLPVVVTGKGFKKGAQAKWFQTGTINPAGVHVKSTQFVSSTQLIATIDIDDGAAIDLFDIEVQNADGRTGKGTELFSVVEKKIDPCTLPPSELTLNASISGVPGYPGYLDSTFGISGTGKALGPRYFYGGLAGSDVAIQTVSGETKYVVAGNLYDPCVNNGQSVSVWAVARYLSDGSLDTSFGAIPMAPGPGIVTTPFSGSAAATDVLIDSDNRIVVAGAAPSASRKGRATTVPTVVRYLPDGGLDTSFGAGTGIVKVPTNGVASMPKGAVLQSDGKIVIGAQDSYSGYLRMVRLNSDGALDTTFNGSGQYLFNKFSSYIGRMTIDSQQRILVAGDARRGVNYPNTGTLWRFTTGGVLDQSFGEYDAVLGTAGLVFTKVNDLPTTYESVAVDGSELVVTGNVYHPDGSKPTEFALARYDAEGTLKWQFVLPCDEGETWPSWGKQVAIQPDGRILVGGSREAGNPEGYITIWRFESDGSLDSTFAGIGWISDPITADTSGYDSFGAFAQQADGKVVVIGHVKEGAMYVPYMFLARLWQ